MGAHYYIEQDNIRLTKAKIQEILNEHEDFKKSVVQYGGDITRHYFIENGKLYFYESGKAPFIGRFDDRIDGVPYVADITCTRNFIRKYIL